MRVIVDRRMIQCVIFMLALSGVSFADEDNEPIVPAAENETSREALVSALQLHLGLYGDLSTDFDIETEDLQSPEAKGQDQQQRDSTGEELDPGFGNFGRAMGYNFTKGLFAKDNLKPLAIGSLATLAMIPLDDEVSDHFQGKSEELGDAGQFIGYAGVAAATGGVLLATPFVKSGRYRGFSFSLAQSIILNNALVFSLKYAVKRTRSPA
jgi:hypothetical protein